MNILRKHNIALFATLLLILFSLCTLFFTYAQAEDSASKPISKEQIKNKLSTIFGGIDITQIKLIDSEVQGFYIMQYASEYGLVSKDGKHYLSGEALNLDTRQNLTEQLRQDYNLAQLKAIKPNVPVSFKAKNPKTSIWVFTDIDCFYCRKLHSEISELNHLGVTVNYLSFPRSGSEDAVDWKKAIDVWCSKDQLEAMTISKQGKSVEHTSKVADCSPNIAQQYAVGHSLGVNGTPAILLANGQLVSGYVPSHRLALLAIESEK